MTGPSLVHSSCSPSSQLSPLEWSDSLHLESRFTNLDTSPGLTKLLQYTCMGDGSAGSGKLNAHIVV